MRLIVLCVLLAGCVVENDSMRTARPTRVGGSVDDCGNKVDFEGSWDAWTEFHVVDQTSRNVIDQAIDQQRAITFSVDGTGCNRIVNASLIR